MIELKGVSYGYNKKNKVIKEVNKTINEGEVICIIGKNGSGKSTLAKIIAGIIKPTNGEVFVEGKNTNDLYSGLKLDNQTQIQI